MTDTPQQRDERALLEASRAGDSAAVEELVRSYQGRVYGFAMRMCRNAGAFFTATSMIGFIAGAGIIVRNSIILVDFIELRMAQGMPLEEAVVDAGAVRFRPMLLTAAAVVVGAFVILFDPIFQGLAISLMAGEVASTLLSRMAVPVLYYMAERRARAAHAKAA